MPTAVEKASSEFEKAYQTAEDILADCIASHRKPRYEESQFMESRLGWDETQQRRQLSRFETVKRLQAEAGTTEQRGKAAQLLDEATQTLEENEPAIAEQINALIAQRDKFRNEVKRLEKMVDGSTSALERLKTVVPRHVAAKSESMRGIVNETIGREFHDLKTKVQHMESLSQPELHASEQMYLECVRRYDRRYVVADLFGEEGGNQWEANVRFSEDWQQHRESLTNELPRLREQLAELEEQFESAKLEANRPLEIYWR